MSVFTVHNELHSLIDIFEDAGGMFALLMYVHFIADFLQQSSYNTDEKYTNHMALLKHSAIYSIQFLPFMFFLQFTSWEIVAGFLWLIVSHFAIDSMWFTKLWVFKLYRPPELFRDRGRLPIYDCETAMLAFDKWSITPNGRMRILLIDQVQHATALWPLVVMTLF